MKNLRKFISILSLLLPLANPLSAQTDFYLGGSDYPAAFTQAEGTLSVSSIFLYPPARFTLQGGQVLASSMIIGQGNTSFRQQRFEPLFAHSDGEVIISGEIALGRQYHGSGVYQLSGGRLSSQVLHLGANRDAAGTFIQSGGTNEAERLLISEEADDPMTLPDSYHHSGYFMTAGTLLTTDTVVGSGREGIFQQNGGTHEVSGTLAIAGGIMRSSYSLIDGELFVQDFWLAGDFTQQGGSFSVKGTTTLDGGNLNLTAGESDFGPLMLANNSTLVFGTSACTARFVDSRDVTWAKDAKLLVRNWSTGTHQLIFGQHAGSITPQQLSQVLFINPVGLPAGNYPARMLSTGEVVPAGLLMTGRPDTQLLLPMRIHTNRAR